VDGAVISTSRKYCLCLNPLSARVSALRESRLAAQFAPGVYDPAKLEAEGRVFVADTDLPRDDLGPVLLYVQRKYNREGQLTELAIVDFSAEMAVTSFRHPEEE